jgi:DNA polymerase III sliding clamp (beta) subunit (PCNA family)
MNRAETLEQLVSLSPALADNELIPMLKHFIFTGSRAYAFNEKIAIITDITTDFAGAVRGKMLIDVLKSSSAEEVTIQKTDSAIKIKAGPSAITLALLDAPDLLKIPKAPLAKDNLITDAKAFISGIEDCLPCVQNFSDKADLLGITLIPNNNTVDMFATNSKTLAQTRVSVQQGALQKRVILPADFCKQIVALGSQDENPVLTISSKQALLSANGYLVCGSLLNTEAPLDFARVISRNVPNNLKDVAVAVPDDLASCLDRAVLITDTDAKNIKTKVTINGGQATFESQSPRGRVVDRVHMKNHPDVSVDFTATYVRDACARYKRILFTENAIVLHKLNSKFMVAVK